MSATKHILVAASLAAIFASGTSLAAPHPQGPGGDANEHKVLEDAAKRVQLDGMPGAKILTGII
jgi:hypothetical protein